MSNRGLGLKNNNKRSRIGPKERFEHQVNDTIIHNLHKSMPPSVLILWKSIPFNRNSQWGYIQSNETVERGHRGINCLIYHANMVAKREILRINSRRLVFVDWAKEVFPHLHRKTMSTYIGPIAFLVLCHLLES